MFDECLIFGIVLDSVYADTRSLIFVSKFISIENDLRMDDTLVHMKGLDDLLELDERCIIVLRFASTSNSICLFCIQFSSQLKIRVLGELWYALKCFMVDHWQSQIFVSRIWCGSTYIKQRRNIDQLDVSALIGSMFCIHLITQLVSNSTLYLDFKRVALFPILCISGILVFFSTIAQAGLDCILELFFSSDIPITNQEIIDLLCAIVSAQGFSNLDPVYKVLCDRFWFVQVLDLSLKDLYVNTASSFSEVSLEDSIADFLSFFLQFGTLFFCLTALQEKFSEYRIWLAPEMSDILSVKRVSCSDVLADGVVLIWNKIELDVLLKMFALQVL